MKSYQKFLSGILDYGTPNQTRSGNTIFYHARQLRHRVSNGFPLLTTKKMYFSIVQKEWLWMMLGMTDTSFLKDRNCSIWDEWSTDEKCAKFNRMIDDMGPIYGHQWRNFGGTFTPHYSQIYDIYLSLVANGVDPKTAKSQAIKDYSDDVTSQFSRSFIDRNTGSKNGGYVYPFLKDGYDQVAHVLKTLKFNPDDRRMIVTGWNPKDANEVELPPCHTMWQFNTSNSHKGRIVNLHLTSRSLDSFLGLPYNLAFYALTLHIFSAMFKYIGGELVITGVNSHLYQNSIGATSEVIERSTFNLPTLTLSKEFREKLVEFGDSITQECTLNEIGERFDFLLTEHWLKPMDAYYNASPELRESGEVKLPVSVSDYRHHSPIYVDVAI